MYQVPPLGQHYSRHWAMEDMEEERREGGRAMENIDIGNRGTTGDWQKESGTCMSCNVESRLQQNKQDRYRFVYSLTPCFHK